MKIKQPNESTYLAYVLFDRIRVNKINKINKDIRFSNRVSLLNNGFNKCVSIIYNDAYLY